MMLKIFALAALLAGTAAATRFHNNGTDTIGAQKSGDYTNYEINPDQFLPYSSAWAFIWSNSSTIVCDGFAFSWPENYGDVYWDFGKLYDAGHNLIQGGQNCSHRATTTSSSATSTTMTTAATTVGGIETASPRIPAVETTPTPSSSLPDGDLTASTPLAAVPDAMVSQDTTHHGLTGGAIAGIVVGVVGGVFLLALLAFFLWRRKQNRDRAHGDMAGPMSATAESNLPGGYQPVVSEFGSSEMTGTTQSPLQEMEETTKKTQPFEMDGVSKRLEIDGGPKTQRFELSG